MEATNKVLDGWKNKEIVMAYKGKGHGPRIKDKPRKRVAWPAGSKSGTFPGGHGGTTTTLAVDDTVPAKKKKKKKK